MVRFRRNRQITVAIAIGECPDVASVTPLCVRTLMPPHCAVVGRSCRNCNMAVSRQTRNSDSHWQQPIGARASLRPVVPSGCTPSAEQCSTLRLTTASPTGSASAPLKALAVGNCPLTALHVSALPFEPRRFARRLIFDESFFVLAETTPRSMPPDALRVVVRARLLASVSEMFWGDDGFGLPRRRVRRSCASSPKPCPFSAAATSLPLDAPWPGRWQ